jgi:hypothetical protein
MAKAADLPREGPNAGTHAAHARRRACRTACPVKWQRRIGPRLAAGDREEHGSEDRDRPGRAVPREDTDGDPRARRPEDAGLADDVRDADAGVHDEPDRERRPSTADRTEMARVMTPAVAQACGPAPA